MMNDGQRMQFTFPVGYHDFHKSQVFNFQLNRWLSFGYARLEDMQEAGQRINSFAEWKTEMVRQADKAVSEGRLMNATFYYRAAEFHTFEEDPDKEQLYDRFAWLFNRVFRDEGIERVDVPYEEAFLPAMRVRPVSGPPRGTILDARRIRLVYRGVLLLDVVLRHPWLRSDRFRGPGQARRAARTVWRWTTAGRSR